MGLNVEIQLKDPVFTSTILASQNTYFPCQHCMVSCRDTINADIIRLAYALNNLT